MNVVLLSYRRMKNLRHIVDSLLVCEFVHEILLSNNNPEVRMEDFIRVRDPRLRIIDQKEHCFPSNRYELARQLPGRYFMSIDDDMFLSPRQIRKLFMALIENSSVPHGAGGEDFVVENGKVISRSHVRGEEREVDVILWAYAFTREHLAGYFMGDAVSLHAAGVNMYHGNRRPYPVDNAMITFRFSSGAVGQIYTSSTALSLKPWERIEVYGDKAWLAVEDQCELILYDDEEGPARSWRPVVPNTLLFDEEFGGFTGLIENFLQVIRGQEKPLVTGWDGYRAYELAAASHLSLKSGSPVSLPLDPDRADREIGRKVREGT